MTPLLSKEWIQLSEIVYGDQFIDEISQLLKTHDVKTVLEACCGGGHVAYGLAQRGFECVALDSAVEMIEHARTRYSHENLRYELENVMNIKESGQFDAVICRGNSLPWLSNWNQPHIKTTDADLNNALSQLFSKAKDGGLIYVDTTSQKEIDLGELTLALDVTENVLEIDTDISASYQYTNRTIHATTQIKHNWRNRTRTLTTTGTINGELYNGVSTSYLVSPAEIKEMMERFNPQKVWHQPMQHEPFYDAICAIK